MKHTLFALLLLTGCSPAKPQARFDFDSIMKIHDGQTYEQVTDIMGEPDYIHLDCRKPDGKPLEIETDVVTVWMHGVKDLHKCDACVMAILRNGLIAGIDIKGIEPPKEKAFPPIRDGRFLGD